MVAEKAGERWGVAERAALLRRVRGFEMLPASALEQVAAAFRARRVDRGAFVFLEGEPARSLNLLASGRVKVIRESDEREVIVRLIGPGDLFGAAGGWGEATYPASAAAQENSVVLSLPPVEFDRLLGAEPAFARAVVRELGLRLREAEARIRDLQTERVERRIARVLLRLVSKSGRRTAQGIEIGIPLSRLDLAELSGTTLSTASRTLSAWDRQGLIRAGRERVVLLKPHALNAFAEDLPAGIGPES